MNLTIRPATIEDIPTILRFIIALAQYEHLEHEVIATENTANFFVGATYSKFFGPSGHLLLVCALLHILNLY